MICVKCLFKFTVLLKLSKFFRFCWQSLPWVYNSLTKREFPLVINAHVRCLLIDFSKAFDVVDHVVLVEKISKLKLPNCALNWLIFSSLVETTPPKPQVLNLVHCLLILVLCWGQVLNPLLYYFRKRFKTCI